MLSKTLRLLPLPAIVDDRSLPALSFTVTVFAYLLFSHLVYHPHVFGPHAVAAYVVLSCLVLGGALQSYAEATASYKTLIRSVIAVALFYIITGHVRIAEPLIGGDWLAEFELNRLWVAAALCGFVGLFRPSFGLVPLVYILWQKHQLMHVVGLPIDWMDYLTVIETGSFLIIGYLILGLVRRLASVSSPSNCGVATWQTRENSLIGTLHPVDALVLFAIALHFGNYFYAGLVKASLGDSPLYWALHNRTELLVLASWDYGYLPISFSSWLPAFTYESMEKFHVVTNLITFVIQLLAVVAIVRIRWVILITLAYDALHLLIFVTTGIFFWKFILLNLAIVAAVSRLRHVTLSTNLKIALAAAVACSPYVFQIMGSFAWIDTPSVNEARVYAVADDGTEYRVPSNFFLGASVTLAQSRMIWPQDVPFLTATWGGTRDFAVAKRSLACDWSQDGAKRPPAVFAMSKQHIREVVRRDHIQILSMADDEGYVDYDLFPHHIFSLPWEFVDFRKLDKRRIRSYRYEIEAVCLGYEQGRIKRRRMFQASFDIPL